MGIILTKKQELFTQFPIGDNSGIFVPMEKQEILARINKRAKELGIKTERALCKAAGFSSSTLKNYRRGNSQTLSQKTLTKLADALKCDISYIIGEISLPKVDSMHEPISEDILALSLDGAMQRLEKVAEEWKNKDSKRTFDPHNPRLVAHYTALYYNEELARPGKGNADKIEFIIRTEMEKKA